LLEKGDTIREKFVVFLCSLAGNLGGDKFPMQGLVVIILVDIQIHFLCWRVLSLGSIRAPLFVVSTIQISTRALWIEASTVYTIIMLNKAVWSLVIGFLKIEPSLSSLL
jgi:hypothetical protein